MELHKKVTVSQVTLKIQSVQKSVQDKFQGNNVH